MREPPSLLLRRVRRPGSDALLDVLIGGGRIVRIEPSGTVAEPGSGAEPFDADGAVLLPGLWDSHVHFRQWALRRERLDLSGATDAPAVLDLVRSQPHRDDALVGYGFRDATWPEPPSQAALDAVAGDRPVVLIAWDLHCAWLSTAAARWLGVRPDPDGVVREAEWFAASRRLDQQTDGSDLGALRRAAQAAAARGVVGIVDVEMADNIATWPERFAHGVDTLRVRAGFYPDRLDAVIDAGLRTGDALDGAGLLTVGPLKVIADGSLNTRTACCRDPYGGPSAGSHEHAGEVGHLEYDVATLTHLITRARSAGLGTAVHAIGDAAVTAALDAYAANITGTGVGRRQPGPARSIEHAQLVHPEDIPRFAELGVIASMQPEHAMDDRDIAEEYWPGRTRWAFPTRDLLDAAARVTFGSDAPVAPLDPWAAIGAAVTRSRDGRTPWHPEQRITAAEAIEASTTTRGLVRAGDVADLVLTAQDPLRCHPSQLRTMDVLGTLLGGRWTHRH